MKKYSNSTSMESYTTKGSHSYYSWSYITLLIFLLTILFTISLLRSNSLNSLPFFQPPQLQSHLFNKTRFVMQRDELEGALAKASMEDKTVIIAVVNKAYVEGKVVPNMLDLFLEGFWSGEGTRELLNHLMIVAIDQTAYDRCIFRGLHCYRLVTDGADLMGEKVFMSGDFIKMMWSRTLFLLNVLQRGYNFIFTDTDVIWLRSPFPILTTNTTQDLDIQFSIDSYNGNSSSPLNPINTGFYFVKSNNKTISLFEKWYAHKDNATGLKEQDVLQNMTWAGVLGDLGLKTRFLETRFFSGFCEDSQDIRDVVTVHANCCRFIRAKVKDLSRVLHEWNLFKVGLRNGPTPVQWSKHMECLRSWTTNA